VSAVAVGAGRDIGIAQGEDLTMIGLFVAFQGIGMATAAVLGDGKAGRGQLRAGDGVRSVAIRADGGIGITSFHRLLAVDRAQVRIQRVGVTASA